jgi:hypothetical protein
MPKKMSMMLNNGGYSKIQLAAMFRARNTQIQKPKSRGIALNSSIIGRIFNARPGCGSCGK